MAKPLMITKDQPELWTVEKEAICAAKGALADGIEYTRELLANHDRNRGRDHRSNKVAAENMEAAIRGMQVALIGLRPASQSSMPNAKSSGKQSACLKRLVMLVRSIRVDRVGIDFAHAGDTVIWTWPWRRNGLPKYISVGFSGTGEFGDARFHTLAELRKAWDDLGNYRSMPFSA